MLDAIVDIFLLVDRHLDVLRAGKHILALVRLSVVELDQVNHIDKRLLDKWAVSTGGCRTGGSRYGADRCLGFVMPSG